jgi:hypothetical protein
MFLEAELPTPVFRGCRLQAFLVPFTVGAPIWRRCHKSLGVKRLERRVWLGGSRWPTAGLRPLVGRAHKTRIAGAIGGAARWAHRHRDRLLPSAEPEVEHMGVETHRVRLAVPDGHRLARASRITLEDLQDEPFISLQRTVSPMFHDLMVQRCARGVSLVRDYLRPAGRSPRSGEHSDPIARAPIPPTSPSSDGTRRGDWAVSSFPRTPSNGEG